MLDKIIETLDKNVFNAETKRLIREEFDSAVKLKSELMSESVIDEYESKIDELNEKFDEYESKIDELNEKIDEYESKISSLEAKAEEYIQLKLDEMAICTESRDEELLDKVDLYLGRIVEEFIKDAKDSLIDSIESKELKVMREAYQAMVESAGVEFNKSILSSSGVIANNEIRALKNQINEMVKDNLRMKQENEKLLKVGTIRELSEGLTIIEAKRFERMSESIPFTRDEKYIKQLEALRETVKSAYTHDEQPDKKTGRLLIPESTRKANDSEKSKLFDFDHLI